MAGKKLPLKLEWRENVLEWVNDNRRALPNGISRPAAHAVVGMLMQSAHTDGKDVMASARWLERETGVNHAAAAEFVSFLVKAGWLEFVGEGLRGVPVYDLISATRRIPPQSELQLPRSDLPQSVEGDRGSDRGSNAEDYSHTTHHRTSLSTKEKVCTSCEREDGHEDDCDYRPFAASPLAAADSEAS